MAFVIFSFFFIFRGEESQEWSTDFVHEPTKDDTSCMFAVHPAPQNNSRATAPAGGQLHFSRLEKYPEWQLVELE